MNRSPALPSIEWARVRRVDRPTNAMPGPIQRIDARDTAYGLANRGEFGSKVQAGVQSLPPTKFPISAAQKDLLDHLALAPRSPVASRVAPVDLDPAGLTAHIKALGYFLKADLMSACHVPESAYYSHDKQGQPVEPRLKNAILIVIRKNLPTIRASKGNDWMGDPISFQAYGRLAFLAETMANYVRRLGWEAEPQYGPSFVDHYQVLMPPLLLASGVGEVSRVGIILNPYFGLAYKAAAILTDMPILPDKPIDFGLQSFCERCGLCAEHCPSHAIATAQKAVYNGYETWKLNTQRCASYNFTNKNGTMCNMCVKVCPWTQPVTLGHNLVRAAVTRSSIAQEIAIQFARRRMPWQGKPNEKWWFDLEYQDGRLQWAQEARQDFREVKLIDN